MVSPLYTLIWRKYNFDMAAYLNVPESIKAALEKLGVMSDSAFKKIEKQFDSIVPSLDPTESLNDDPALSEIMRAIISMNMARNDINVPLEKFIGDLLKSLKKKKDGLHKDFSDSKFSERIAKLINNESLTLSSRAIDVRHGLDAYYMSSRIFSDIRPVFDATGSKPLGAMVVHNLKITYHQNSEHKELYLAIDNDDLAALKKILDRAEVKTSSTESLIKKTGLHFFKTNSK